MSPTTYDLLPTMSKQTTIQKEDYRFGFHDEENYHYKSGKGLSEEIVRMISAKKNEPKWLLDRRLHAYEWFNKKPMPKWGPNLSGVFFDKIHYYVQPSDKVSHTWEDVPDNIKDTFEKLGIPEAERKFLAGVGAQYESEVLYHNLQKELEDQGVVFLNMDQAVHTCPEIMEKYFGTIIPAGDNKFAALNTAVWSGGSFIYVPKGVKVDLPLQAYFRINTENMGQFERTLIIADEGSYVHYIEGCSAPVYSSDSLHSAVVELIALKGARIRYTTIQNWSKNVYNLVTKRAVAYEDALVEWIDGNIGSKVTQKYPAVYLMGRGARGEVLSLAFAGEDQTLDTGAKMVHCAPDTSSRIIAKSISQKGGTSSYRGLVEIMPGATNSKSSVQCDALLLDEQSRSDTYPIVKIHEDEVEVTHEATVSQISEEQLFYLQSRGVDADTASSMLVNGFIEPIVKTLPMEYAVELNRLIELEMEGAIG